MHHGYVPTWTVVVSWSLGHKTREQNHDGDFINAGLSLKPWTFGCLGGEDGAPQGGCNPRATTVSVECRKAGSDLLPKAARDYQRVCITGRQGSGRWIGFERRRTISSSTNESPTLLCTLQTRRQTSICWLKRLSGFGDSCAPHIFVKVTCNAFKPAL